MQECHSKSSKPKKRFPETLISFLDISKQSKTKSTYRYHFIYIVKLTFLKAVTGDCWRWCTKYAKACHRRATKTQEADKKKSTEKYENIFGVEYIFVISDPQVFPVRS